MEYLQYIIVALVVLAAVAVITARLRRTLSGRDGCANCPGRHKCPPDQREDPCK